MNISVCIATYNGELYVIDQLKSIIPEIGADDEIIIVDDCSTDRTVERINSLDEPRIRLYKNTFNRGHVFTFSRAIGIAQNELIFLADQDDIWIKGRIAKMKMEMCKSKVLVLSSNFDRLYLDGTIKSGINSLKSQDSNKYIQNIFAIFLGKRGYFGCSMAFHRKIIQIILPIPAYVVSHDLWIAIAGNLLRSNVHLEEVSLIWRVHNNNTSILDRNIIEKIITRINYLRSIIILSYRILRRAVFRKFN